MMHSLFICLPLFIIIVATICTVKLKLDHQKSDQKTDVFGDSQEY